MPGYLFFVDDTGRPRPTVIYTNGFDSTREEGYFVIGAAALRRGYNFLAYDGPGQGWMIREKNVPYRPDWENVLGPVVDYALTVPKSTAPSSSISATAWAVTWSRGMQPTTIGRRRLSATTG
jgi:hypothetical protein